MSAYIPVPWIYYGTGIHVNLLVACRKNPGNKVDPNVCTIWGAALSLKLKHFVFTSYVPKIRRCLIPVESFPLWCGSSVVIWPTSSCRTMGQWLKAWPAPGTPGLLICSGGYWQFGVCRSAPTWQATTIDMLTLKKATKAMYTTHTPLIGVSQEKVETNKNKHPESLSRRKQSRCRKEKFGL